MGLSLTHMLFNTVLQWLRRLGLRDVIDRMRMLWQRRALLKENQEFLRENPNVTLPADEIMYETFNLNYRKYFEGGRKTAKEILSHFQESAQKDFPDSILDWGCGPGRVIRHMPEVLPKSTHVVGSDFNGQTIEWCRQHIPNVQFMQNALMPPIKLENESMEWVYCISVLTHLSKDAHHAWIQEIYRILRIGGYFLMTTQGDAFINKLTNSEIKQYSQGQIVIRDGVEEGRRTFSAFHPPAYIKALTKDYKVRKHVPGSGSKDQPQQDIWLLSKDV